MRYRWLVCSGVSDKLCSRGPQHALNPKLFDNRDAAVEDQRFQVLVGAVLSSRAHANVVSISILFCSRLFYPYARLRCCTNYHESPSHDTRGTAVCCYRSKSKPSRAAVYGLGVRRMPSQATHTSTCILVQPGGGGGDVRGAMDTTCTLTALSYLGHRFGQRNDTYPQHSSVCGTFACVYEPLNQR